MFEYLYGIDKNILFAINNCNSPFVDEFMWIVSSKWIWIPLYFVIIYLIIKKYKKSLIKVFLLIIICLSLSDFVSSGIIKKSFKRERPSHNIEIENKLHYYKLKDGSEYRGGKYGFVSSHAANSLTIALLTMWLLNIRKKIILLLLLWVLLVSYSRIYLGVHYLSDIVGGYIVSMSIVLIAYIMSKKIKFVTQSY